MNDIQIKLVEILKWFHCFCTENGLTYYAVGGTLLGTIRHDGFIPWDDDIDLAMPRPDYDKFVKLTRGKIFGQYLVETMMDNNMDFTYLYAKVYDTQTTLIEHRKRLVKRGLFIDVYPIDGVGDTMEEAKKFYKPLGIKISFLTSRVSAIRKGRSFMKNVAVIIAKIIPETLISINKELRVIDNYCRQKDYYSCNYVGPLYGLHGSGEIVPREWFGNPKSHPFEELVINIPECYEEYLKYIYGNWKCLPAKEKQVTHHDFLSCDLNNSYLIS